MNDRNHSLHIHFECNPLWISPRTKHLFSIKWLCNRERCRERAEEYSAADRMHKLNLISSSFRGFCGFRRKEEKGVRRNLINEMSSPREETGA